MGEPENGSRRFLRPGALGRFDRVAVVAPAGPVEQASFEAGVRVLAERYRPSHSAGVLTRTRYVAGDDGRRLDELIAALADDSVKAIFTARGGYGSLRLLPKLWSALEAGASNPKPLIGFSDITALHLAAQAAGWMSVHGPVVTQLATQPPESVERLFRLLESTAAPAPPLAGMPLWGGVAEGPLLGGNLSLLTRLLGTPYLPSLAGVILLLEDVGERPYRLDRMWTHLALAGVFNEARGIALGEFTDCEEPEAEYTSAEVLRALAAEAGLPCVGALPIGHGAVNLAVPLGSRVRLDGDAGTLVFLEPLVAAPAAP